MDLADAYVHSALDSKQEAAQLAAYMPLLNRVLRQLVTQVGAVLDREDMEQIGLMALLDSLRRYGTPDDQFVGFALLRMRGAILDELRRLDWRPRSVRQSAHRIRDEIRALRKKLGREPSEADAIAGLNISAKEYRDYQMAENAEVLASFDDLLSEGVHEAGGAESPENGVINRLSLARALSGLDEKEQRVIQMYYEFELNLKEIALVLDLTEARVCQINKSAIKKMKTALGGA
ncbi:RNA polymerase sigma factor FliA [Iodobacter fluviatilis]|uniref:RNA polymerase sigma-28 (SigD/FliA/WhiG) subunit n=1 Tax=Iodobacter fluviatilis TaxID=537 RepID=A0A377ST41_9NEIS|nr:RNA polymerase sigma factor FliA [Iodobacter fluviatilis]TCU86124.1 RNA polymerase sigma-28 (SigD/FliA/WhiG) subunit [Iodobacter fluviatilis]STR44535.1 Sigma-F factor [Iodobacter fluviatilis]